jgi:hypothetical protein
VSTERVYRICKRSCGATTPPLRCADATLGGNRTADRIRGCSVRVERRNVVYTTPAVRIRREGLQFRWAGVHMHSTSIRADLALDRGLRGCLFRRQSHVPSGDVSESVIRSSVRPPRGGLSDSRSSESSPRTSIPYTAPGLRDRRSTLRIRRLAVPSFNQGLLHPHLRLFAGQAVFRRADP